MDKIKIYMVFGKDATRAFEDYQDILMSDDPEVKEEGMEEASEYIKDSFESSDNLIVREFNTQAEVDAYFQGMNDIDGWEGSLEITEEEYLAVKKIVEG